EPKGTTRARIRTQIRALAMAESISWGGGAWGSWAIHVASCMSMTVNSKKARARGVPRAHRVARITHRAVMRRSGGSGMVMGVRLGLVRVCFWVCSPPVVWVGCGLCFLGDTPGSLPAQVGQVQGRHEHQWPDQECQGPQCGFAGAGHGGYGWCRQVGGYGCGQGHGEASGL